MAPIAWIPSLRRRPSRSIRPPSREIRKFPSRAFCATARSTRPIRARRISRSSGSRILSTTVLRSQCGPGIDLERFQPVLNRGQNMKLSARNQISGKIVELHKGQTTAHVQIEIGGGVRITSSITNEAVDDLGLKSGDNVQAVI